MTKIAVASDFHYGCRGDNHNFYDYQKKFLDNKFFPRLIKDKIKHFIFLGDLVDNRRQLNYQTAKRLHEDFLEPLDGLGINCHFILGNHDLTFKDNKQVHAYQEVLDRYDFNLYVYPEKITIDNKKILMLPWIIPSEKDRTTQILNISKADYCMAHLELKGFEQTKGRLAEHGYDSTLFGNFSHVFSGHYHIPSSKDNIHYIGSSFQFNWGDSSNDSGLLVFDTDTDEILKVCNPYTMFNTVEYDEDAPISLSTDWKGSYLKVNIVNKKSETKFKKYLDYLESYKFADIIINENLAPVQVSGKIIKSNSTLDIFKETIFSLDTPYKNEIETLTNEIYQEALSV